MPDFLLSVISRKADRRAGAVAGGRISDAASASARVVEQWARSGATDMPPELPGGADLDGLRLELVEAERLAEAAKSTIAALSANVSAAQGSVQVAIDRMREAVARVLTEEADAMVDELIESERRAAIIRGEVRALQHHLQLDVARGNRGAAPLPDLVRRKLSEKIVMTDPEIQRRAARWTAFAERLLTDETATLD